MGKESCLFGALSFLRPRFEGLLTCSLPDPSPSSRRERVVHIEKPGSEIPQDSVLPAVPAEHQSARARTIRQVRSIYTDVPCESAALERAYGARLAQPGDVAALGFQLLAHEAQEVFAALLLNGKHRVVGFIEVSRGTLTTSLVHPREVFGPALRENAAALIVLHNHPSGDPEPSAEDLSVTERLKRAGELLGIPMLDHVIVGDSPTSFVSLRERLNL